MSAEEKNQNYNEEISVPKSSSSLEGSQSYNLNEKSCNSNMHDTEVQQMSLDALMARKKQLESSIQEVSLSLGQLLEQRHYLHEEVAGRHVTIAQLLRVQEARATELGLQPAVQMSPAPRR